MYVGYSWLVITVMNNSVVLSHFVFVVTFLIYNVSLKNTDEFQVRMVQYGATVNKSVRSI